MAKLETFKNRYQGREYEIEITCPEFTCLCPITGQPDFAVIRIKYVPDELCIELKSLKLYIFSYRNVGEFHEHVTNKILDDIVEACKPIRAEVIGDFNVRGGIKTVVKATYSRDKDSR
ncbi:MAG: NADPH-dependent 7-cyano-7-deazaguanine reductase [Deltaproteobacteria bacterium]|jgi:7-cyano-7-deazaguanine reductase|nr:MAG: NADPH-dependent 7-cyano-7-deazaguanine reductase [Deltaproteobacteria bacterium]